MLGMTQLDTPTESNMKLTAFTILATVAMTATLPALASPDERNERTASSERYEHGEYKNDRHHVREADHDRREHAEDRDDDRDEYRQRTRRSQND